MYETQRDPIRCRRSLQEMTFVLDDMIYPDFKLTAIHSNQWFIDNNSDISYSANYKIVDFVFADFTPQNNVLVNGNNYNNVYIMTCDTSKLTNPNVWRIYYTKQNGILRFDVTQGLQWERIN